MRHYLLLGQGDFFRHLMDLLKYVMDASHWAAERERRAAFF